VRGGSYQPVVVNVSNAACVPVQASAADLEYVVPPPVPASSLPRWKRYRLHGWTALSAWDEKTQILDA
jgi:hypothetical protein